ncbi:MAG: TRAP transporter substrate-binding protein [Pseudomonadota bacterium]
MVVERGRATVVAMAALLLGTTAANAAEYEFKLHHFLSQKAPAHTDMLVPWAERVEANSDGRVSIEIFPSMSLGGKPPELIRQARDGVVDLVWTVNGYTPSLFPRTEVFELPTVFSNDARATNLAMQEMFDEHLADDYDGVEVMFLHVHAGQALQMVDQEVRTPADTAGLKLRIPTRTGAWVIEALGAAPAAMPVPDLPQALSRKVVDGALIPFEIIPALQLQDQTQYQIEGADGWRLGTTTFQVSMNEDRWNDLPEDIQRAFRDASGPEWWAEVGDVWQGNDDRAIGIATAAGNTHVVLTEAETEAFEEALAPVADRWIQETTADGIDGQALVDRARELVAKHAN